MHFATFNFIVMIYLQLFCIKVIEALQMKSVIGVFVHFDLDSVLYNSSIEFYNE